MKKIDYNIILCGFMGCGKTTTGKLLAQKLGLNFVDTDYYIETKMNMTVSEIFKKYGESYFRDLENELAQNFKNFIPSVLSLGGGMLQNHKNIPILKSTGKIIYLDASIATIKKRLKNDNTRPLLKSHKDIELLYNSRYETYTNASDMTVFAEQPPYNICEDIIKKI